MVWLSGTFVVTLCIVFTHGLSSATLETDKPELSADSSELFGRIPRDVKFTFPGQDRISPPPTALCFREPCNLPRGFQGPAQYRHRRSPTEFDEDYRVSRSAQFDNGFRDFTPESNTRGSIFTTRNFGEGGHGGWESTAKIEHDFWKSDDGNQKVTGYLEHDRIDGGKFDGFKDTKGGLGYTLKFRRSPNPDDEESNTRGDYRVRRSAQFDNGFRDFTPESNTRGSIFTTRNFGERSHGGWESTAKIEHDFWKSNDGNQKVTGYLEHDRIDGGKIDGFKDTKGGLIYTLKFRRSPNPYDE
ncbi:uncharacterized protein LOC142329039 [Lycorma delicatula]|uniref:uncharacterized protein LOC142329039 n=1 Tax=Lycorma delicatula TaxID=130591 RepID=UPI003F519F68